MRFREAKKLHNGNEVLIRDSQKDFRPAIVVEIIIDEKDVFIRCDDGFLYHHSALK